jgi:hypothetical protein
LTAVTFTVSESGRSCPTVSTWPLPATSWMAEGRGGPVVSLQEVSPRRPPSATTVVRIRGMVTALKLHLPSTTPLECPRGTRQPTPPATAPSPTRMAAWDTEA